MKRKNVFGLFGKELRDIVGERFAAPTPIQEGVIPAILKGRNVLTISETGSGKTEAAMLPVFDMWLKEKPKPISILYITPLRSLNRDLLKRIRWWSEKIGFSVSVRHGDTSQSERSRQARTPPDMLISTPETLQAMLTGKVMRKNLKNIRYLIIDEVHELVPNKRGLQLCLGLERLKVILDNKPLILCMSATIGSPEKVVKFFSLDENSYKIINVTQNKKRDIRVESPKRRKRDKDISLELMTSADIAARVRRIREIIEKHKSVLVFTNTREFSEILSSRLKSLDKNLPIETHHSSLSSNVRILAERDFKKSKIKALVCTSSLELGIDIGSIDMVIQYMSPRQVSKLLQRIGRSGHSMEKTSKGIIISTEPDDCFESAAIAQLAVKGQVEPTEPYNGAWDVLAGQILGLSLDEYKISAERAYKILKNAYPYRNLKMNDFMETARVLQKLRLLWVDSKFESEPVLKRRKRTFFHYYQNLSTIPDTKNYVVYDVVSDKPVGNLDAEFVALHGHQGTSFIVKGQAWKILDVRKSRVLVEPVPGIRAAIPAWEGELIPVPFEVSQMVGKMRRKIRDMIKKGERRGVIKKISKSYPVTKDVAEKMYSYVKRQMEWGCVPDDRKLLVEYYSDGDDSWMVIHSCWGSLINDTIGRVLSFLLTKKLDAVGLQTDAYRIILKLQHIGDWKYAKETFMNLKPEDIETASRHSIPDTELFLWRFIHVAKRFGIISKDADFGKGYIKKIIDVYKDTPPYREALNEVLKEKMDISGARNIIKKLNSGKIGVDVRAGISPFGTAGIQRKYEIVAPQRPEREIFRTFKKRLFGTSIGLVCMHCGDYATIVQAGKVPQNIKCPKCSARLISAVPARYLIEAQNLVKKKKSRKGLGKEEERYYSQMLDSAGLVMSSGRRTVIALAGRGVGVKTAGRILSKMLDEEGFLREILKAEKNYAKTKRFWKS